MTRDFDNMLADLGMTEEEMLQRTAYQDDRVQMPPDEYKFRIDSSPIHGRGIFAMDDYEAGEVVGVYRIGFYRTPLGYLANHSDTPNAEGVAMIDGGGYLRTTQNISAGDEIVVDYRQSMREAHRAEQNAVVFRSSQGVRDSFAQLMTLFEQGASKNDIRAAIDVVECELLKMPQADHGLEHLFTDGLYIRVADILPGVLFSTPHYREECILTILQGRLLIISEDGAVTIDQPTYVLTKIGTKRLIFAIERVLAHTAHPNPTNEHDIAVLEKRIYADSVTEIEIEGSLL